MFYINHETPRNPSQEGAAGFGLSASYEPPQTGELGLFARFALADQTVQPNMYKASWTIGAQFGAPGSGCLGVGLRDDDGGGDKGHLVQKGA